MIAVVPYDMPKIMLNVRIKFSGLICATEFTTIFPISTTNVFLSIARMLQDNIHSFKKSLDLSVIAPDIIKVFDRVYHIHLLHKLPPYGSASKKLQLDFQI